MCIGRKVRPHALLMAGFAALVIANIGGWWIRRHSGWTESWADGASGFLMGIAIALMLVGFVRTRNQ